MGARTRLPMRKELWAFTGNRIAVRFEYEFHDDTGQWHRAYGNENWEFAANGLMQRRFASINDLPIAEAERTSNTAWFRLQFILAISVVRARLQVLLGLRESS